MKFAHLLKSAHLLMLALSGNLGVTTAILADDTAQLGDIRVTDYTTVLPREIQKTSSAETTRTKPDRYRTRTGKIVKPPIPTGGRKNQFKAKRGGKSRKSPGPNTTMPLVPPSGTTRPTPVALIPPILASQPPIPDQHAVPAIDPMDLITAPTHALLPKPLASPLPSASVASGSWIPAPKLDPLSIYHRDKSIMEAQSQPIYITSRVKINGTMKTVTSTKWPSPGHLAERRRHMTAADEYFTPGKAYMFQPDYTHLAQGHVTSVTSTRIETVTLRSHHH